VDAERVGDPTKPVWPPNGQPEKRVALVECGLPPRLEVELAIRGIGSGGPDPDRAPAAACTFHPADPDRKHMANMGALQAQGCPFDRDHDVGRPPGRQRNETCK